MDFIPQAATSNGFVAAPTQNFTTYDGRNTSRESSKRRVASSGSRERAGAQPLYFNQKGFGGFVIDAKSRNGVKLDNYMTADPIMEH